METFAYFYLAAVIIGNLFLLVRIISVSFFHRKYGPPVIHLDRNVRPLKREEHRGIVGQILRGDMLATLKEYDTPQKVDKLAREVVDFKTTQQQLIYTIPIHRN